MVDYEVVVVGAGTAGSATARIIAQLGPKVMVVEKRRAVGQPLRCSGLLSPRSLTEVEDSQGLVLNPIRGATVHSPSGMRLDVGGDRVYALAIDRAALDERLVEQAQRAGAEFLLDTRLMGIERTDRSLRLTLRRNKRAFQITTRLLVGADGVGSLVVRWMGSHDTNGVVRAVGAEGYLQGSDPDRVQIFVGNSVAPGWFGWIIPLGDGRVRIGTGNGNHARVPVKQLLSNLVATFPVMFRRVRFDRIWTKTIPVYSPMKTYGDNVLVVGDAARQVKPLSGGGIYTGLVAARHCARVAVEALRAGDLSEAFLSRYEAAWRGELGAELERGLNLRKVFLRLRDEEKEKLLTIFGMPSLQRVISQFGDIDFPSRLLEQLVRVTPWLRPLLCASLRSSSRWAADLLSLCDR